MRPLYLTIQGIGSYRNKQSIDFTACEDFFLITGDTGSGKTTIFDAIMFALYGNVPGTRSAADLINAGIDSDSVPFAEFTFSLNKKQYKIQRSPAYLRKKKKGEGFTEQQETVTLHEYVHEQWNEHTGKKTDIDDKIYSMLKFTADEFSKLILLPQGEFQKFLISETKEKRELLEKIFPAELYKKCSLRFNELKNELSAQKKQVSKSLKEKLSVYNNDNFEADRNLILNEKLELQKLISEKDKLAKTKSNELSEALNTLKLFAEFDQKKKEKLELENQKKINDQKQLKLDNYRCYLKYKPDLEKYNYIKEAANKRKVAIEELKQQLSKADRDFTGVFEKFRKIQIYRDELVKIEKEKEKIEKLIPGFETYKVLKNEIINNEAFIKNNENYLTELKKKIILAENEIKLREEFKDKNKNCAENYNELIGKNNQIDNVIRGKTACADSKMKYSVLSNKLKSLEDLLKNEKEKSINFESKLLECRANENNILLSRLAEKIKDGMPCPLCGASHHPNIFHSDKNSEFDYSVLEKFERLKSEADKKAASFEKEIEINQKELNDVKNLFNSDVSYEDEIGQLEIEKKTNSGKIEATKLLIAQLNEADKLLKKQNNEKDSLNVEIMTLSESLSAAKIKYASDFEIIKNIDVQLNGITDPVKEDGVLKERIVKGTELIAEIEVDYAAANEKKIRLWSEIEAVEQQIIESNSELAQLEKIIETIVKKEKIGSIEIIISYNLTENETAVMENEISLYSESVIKNSEAINFYETKLGTAVKPDYNSIKKVIEEIESEILILTRKREAVNEKLILLENYKKEYDKMIAEFNELNERSADVEKMAMILNGTNSKNMTFQDYILAGYLQEVLNSANKRLLKISDGQYRLKRRIEKEKGMTKSGLEFNVTDIFNGTEREVQSLSGGEKFLASLCLALGLSDVIQSRSGANELEALFIDEGFGSLDEQSLERAISILDEVRGNRMVGIISHVRELKARIPSKIVVKKTLNGSQISIN